MFEEMGSSFTCSKLHKPAFPCLCLGYGIYKLDYYYSLPDWMLYLMTVLYWLELVCRNGCIKNFFFRRKKAFLQSSLIFPVILNYGNLEGTLRPRKNLTEIY